MKELYLLTARQGFGLGDIVLVTALARDLSTIYPGRFDLEVNTNFRPVWDNNPYVRRTGTNPLVPANRRIVRISYIDAIRRSQQGEQRHFINAFHDNFQHQTGIKVWPTQPHGELYLTEEEKRPLVSGRYWVILAGGKNDMTVKHWTQEKYQSVVDQLAERNIFCVQAGAAEPRHLHKPLQNCINLVGRTSDMRNFFSLIYNAEGVICGITSGMHIAACFDKPAVIIAGGREEPWFSGYANAYPQAFGAHCEPVKVEQQFLHTLGLLKCCETRGCWKKRTVPLEPKDYTPNGRRFICVDQIGDQPTCLNLIQPQHVIEAVESYYKVLPPPEPQRPALTSRVAATPPSIGVVPSSPTTTTTGELIRHEAHPLRGPAKLVRHAIFDNPIIGGKFTLFILTYGDHTDILKKCLESITNTVPLARLDIRVACNAVSDSTLQYLSNQPVSVVYNYETNRYKYPVMREIFRDPDMPIRTNYTIWFDDDSYVQDKDWLAQLGQSIIANHPHGGRMYGAVHRHPLSLFLKGGHEPRQWFWDSPVYKTRNFMVSKGSQRSAPNGTWIEFVVGSFWAIHTPLIEELDIPDIRLKHNGGDIAIGAAIQLAGKNYKHVNFTPKKGRIICSGAARRGYSEYMPWADEESVKEWEIKEAERRRANK